MNKQRQTMLWASSAALMGALGWVGWRRWRREIETPSYQVLATKGGLEVRQYGPAVVAATDLQGSFTESLRAGFHLLAGYIFGGNQRHQSIAMTAPVGLQRRGNAWRMTFVMPSSFSSLETLPAPNDSRVQLEPVPGRRVAVRRFSGSATEAAMKEEEAWLLAELRRQGLRPVGAPVLAQYNAPFVPPFMRRNEIHIDVQPLEWVH
ncbi:SOUL family heme-binding protein [Melittangium boletus]|uniref:Soul heme-binding family protein n=1 Tax=Melittangium boletus DSM 14713 TaxID=1294270 RepID=A0A250IF76_9BACT|nr:heme-binding protein [Melittangium boletus]ATB30489.1 soul heme-binding family protein [Melittangium boletus DSM 14713]